VRTALAGNRVARVIFCFHDDVLVALNGFIKKTRKTPLGELDLARDRMKELSG
jgi:phage-related protein